MSQSNELCLYPAIALMFSEIISQNGKFDVNEKWFFLPTHHDVIDMFIPIQTCTFQINPS